NLLRTTIEYGCGELPDESHTRKVRRHWQRPSPVMWPINKQGLSRKQVAIHVWRSFPDPGVLALRAVIAQGEKLIGVHLELDPAAFGEQIGRVPILVVVQNAVNLSIG